MNKREEEEIWKEHFDKGPKELIKTGTKGSSEVEVEQIFREDVEKAISNVKVGLPCLDEDTL
jgi:hypothetical protein